MAIVSVPVWHWPTVIDGPVADPTSTQNVTLNGSGHKAAFIFRAPKTGNIHKIGVRLGSITTPTDTDFRLETVSAQFPTGTLYGTNTNGTITSGSLSNGVMNMVTLTADAAVTANDLLAVVVVPSGTPNYQVSRGGNNTGGQLPYSAVNTGSWAASTARPIFAIEYSDGTYAVIDIAAPFSSVNTHTFNSGSTPDEIGAKFRFPVSVRLTGAWLSIDLDNTTEVVLYSSDGVTPLLTSSLMTSDGRQSTGGLSPYLFRFPSTATLSANTYYYLSVKPGASSVSIYSWDMLSAAALDQLPGGQDWHYVSAKDPSGTGSWTPILTRYPIMGLLIDGIDDGARISRHPGMGGGFNA